MDETKEKDGESRDDISQENEIGDAEARAGGDGVAERKGRYNAKGHPSLFDEGSDATLPLDLGGETAEHGRLPQQEARPEDGPHPSKLPQQTEQQAERAAAMAVLGAAENVVMQQRLGYGRLYAQRDEKSEIAEASERFDRELQQQIDGTLPHGHIYELGHPGAILRSTGIPDLPIQLSAKRLEDKATRYGHDFNLAEIKGLVDALQNPVAVFAYGDEGKAQNIIIEIEHDGNHYVVGLSLNPEINGKRLEINSVRNVFPKKNTEWLNWIAQGKMLYANKEKIQTLISQLQTIPADVTYLDLDTVAKVVKDFENPKLRGGYDRVRLLEE